MTPENYIKSNIYCESTTHYVRRNSWVVNIGNVPLGGNNPIRLQSMTTTNTMDTEATIAQSIRMIEGGSEYVRITAPSINEANNLKNIKDGLRAKGYKTPIIADIHFTPNAAEIAARIVEKVRVNPGNYVDKKKFEVKEYSDFEYEAELDRIRQRFEPLVKICKEYGTAMRIGTNHGSLSDRIMNRYGDTPMGMVESAMEFIRICEDLNYRQIVLSMKASNPQVMVQAYRLLVSKMNDEGLYYPLHLGVTEAGEAEEGRIKSAMGIGALLEDGLGDTVRVSLTEEPEFEIPVARDIVSRYEKRQLKDLNIEKSKDSGTLLSTDPEFLYSPFNYSKRETFSIANIGGHNVPRVIADLSLVKPIDPFTLRTIGYVYDPVSDKWNMGEQGADYIYFGKNVPGFMLPSGAKGIYDYDAWQILEDKANNFPIFETDKYFKVVNPEKIGIDNFDTSLKLNFVKLRAEDVSGESISTFKDDKTVVFCLYSEKENKLQAMRDAFRVLNSRGIKNPVIIFGVYEPYDKNSFLLQSAADMGGLLIEGFGDGIFAICDQSRADEALLQTRFINETLFYILQASRTRISKTEYISCPSCGRTLFDLQETTALIRAKTDHLKGVKIAIMGCIVNGPGEMADADYGYVGTGPGKITLYRGKDVVKRNIPGENALEELINLVKEDGYWVEK